jgi:hypothetical protein
VNAAAATEALRPNDAAAACDRPPPVGLATGRSTGSTQLLSRTRREDEAAQSQGLVVRERRPDLVDQDRWAELLDLVEREARRRRFAKAT